MEEKTKKKTGRSRCTLPEFIVAWQSSRTAKEAAKRLGINVAGVHSRAGRCRLLGIPLKGFKVLKRNEPYIEQLKSLAKESYR